MPSPQSPSDEHELNIRTTDKTGQSATQATGRSHAGPVSSDADRELVTSRFKHVITDGGHAIATERDVQNFTRCEDEPIHIPGAIQGFGLLIAFHQREKLSIRIVSENSQKIIGHTPEQLFALEDFTSILSEEQADSFSAHLNIVRGDADAVTTGPEVFSLSICSPTNNEVKTWCAMHINDKQPHLVICEFELEDDQDNPLAPPSRMDTPDSAENTLNSDPTEEEWSASTRSSSKPLRLLRDVRNHTSTTLAALEVSRVITQVQEQLGAQPTLQGLLDVLVGLIQDLTKFHRVMVYQFDQAWNGKVVAELLDPRTTKDLYKGLNFPAGDIPRQARELYKINKIRLLYDRDQESARLVCRTTEDLANPLDLTYSYLRAMSPIHSQYLRNMAVRSSFSISITAFGELWGLIACHSYGPKGLRVSFPTRDLCRIIGDLASSNIERISYTSRLKMRTLINTVPPKKNPSGYITASSEDLLRHFSASFGCLTIRDETKMLGQVNEIEASQEILTILEYLRKKNMTKVTTSSKIEEDFPDLEHPLGLHVIAGLLLIPLSSRGQDFIVFFRGSQTKEAQWAGTSHEKQNQGHLTPGTSFKSWTQSVTGSREWTEEELEAAAVMCLVYGKFIEIWRQKEAVLQNSQITRLLLANSAHEIRTPLNAIVNYLEIALEDELDHETRDNLTKSYAASKSLIYVINDLLDLTASVEGGDVVQNETFDLRGVLHQATGWFSKDAQRKQISYQVTVHSELRLPPKVIGDARRLRQAISNIVANAIENTTAGGVKVDITFTLLPAERVEIEICVSDTGVGMSAQKINTLFSELAQGGLQNSGVLDDTTATARNVLIQSMDSGEDRTLGLGLAVVARIVHNMSGQLRLKSEENRGSRFVLVFTFVLPKLKPIQAAEPGVCAAVADPDGNSSNGLQSETASPSNIAEEITLVGFGGESVAFEDNAGSDRTGSGFFPGASAEDRVNCLTEPVQPVGEVEELTSPREGNNALPRGAVVEQGHAARITEDAEFEDSSKDPLQKVAAPRKSQQHSTQSEISTIQGQGKHTTTDCEPPATHTSYDAPDAPQEVADDPSRTRQPSSVGNMRILVAEDDMVNSRIIEKRLKKIGCEVRLTSNGEECAYVYREEDCNFDVILMDIQMPIMDGHTSTKAIRSFERSRPSNGVSPDGSPSIERHVPIIAVSATLVQREHDFYVDVGFDGWILKPISFDRLRHIMTGVTEPAYRKEDLYQAGSWERGGWFKEEQTSIQRCDE